MNPIFYGLGATFLISLGSFAGVLTLIVGDKYLSKIIFLLVSLSSGVLIGNAFIHLLPEASKSIPSDTVFGIVLFAFVIFFLIEKLFHWQHCHKVHCESHVFGYMNLFGDAIHNCIDGIIIGGTFVTSIPLGMLTAVTIGLHEIPKEVSDFGVLLHSGFSKKKALYANFLVKLTIVLGSVIGFFFAESVHGFVSYLLPFAAGGFLYIAGSDLIPEIKKEDNPKKSTLSFIIFLFGIGLAYATKMLGAE
jgi:zinc and cadmium transporter